MAVELEIHPAALDEIQSAASWYSERSDSAAAAFIAELDKAIEFIVAAPSRWPLSKHGTRKFVLNRFPFAVFYRFEGSLIQILAVANGHRRPGYWKGRS